MATSLDSYAPFDTGAGSGVTEPTWRKMMGHLTLGRNGVLYGSASNNMEVYADSTGMQVKVRTGEVWIKGHWGEVASEKTLTIAAANATLSRKDRVVVRCDFSNDLIELDVLTGTAASSPSAPALTQSSSIWEVSLAIVDIPASDTNISSSQVTDKRAYANRTYARYRSASNQSLPNNSITHVNFATTETASPYDIEQLTNATYQINLTGWWRLEAGVRFDSAGDGYRSIIIGPAGSLSSTRYVEGKYSADSSESMHPQVSTSKYLTAGTVLAVGAYQNRGSSMGISESHQLTYFALTWEGP